jgi:hypothetical protein
MILSALRSLPIPKTNLPFMKHAHLLKSWYILFVYKSGSTVELIMGYVTRIGVVYFEVRQFVAFDVIHHNVRLCINTREDYKFYMGGQWNVWK